MNHRIKAFQNIKFIKIGNVVIQLLILLTTNQSKMLYWRKSTLIYTVVFKSLRMRMMNWKECVKMGDNERSAKFQQNSKIQYFLMSILLCCGLTFPWSKNWSPTRPLSTENNKHSMMRYICQDSDCQSLSE